MANLKSLAKDTAIYGLSSIVGRFLNYLMVPLYTYTLKKCSDYGIVADLYAQVGLLFAILTFGMETTFFRFINKEEDRVEKMKVYSTALMMVGGVGLLFIIITMLFLNPIATAEGYADHKWYVGMMYLVIAQDAFQAIMYAYLRNEHRPIKFMCLKLAFIFLSVTLNMLCFYFLPRWSDTWEVSVKWVFVINLICTTTISFCFYKELTGFKWVFDKVRAKQMAIYSWPILVLSIAGILNQVAGQLMLPRVLEKEEGRHLLGIYEAGVKIAAIMVLITQAFRYAYEPFVFGSAKQKGSKEMYGSAMKYFIVFTLAAYLCVVGYQDILKFFVGENYRIGLQIVPIVMAAEIMMGIAVNLSFWYKLIDKTIYGAWFSLAGCAVLLAINFIFIPKYGYWACAWAGFAGYGTTMVLSYIFGQRINPIPYPTKSIACFVLLAAAIFAAMMYLPSDWNEWLRMGINTILILIYLAFVVKDILDQRRKKQQE